MLTTDRTAQTAAHAARPAKAPHGRAASDAATDCSAARLCVDRWIRSVQLLRAWGQQGTALSLAREALAQTPAQAPGAATLHYLVALCLDALGRGPEAAAHYALAIDEALAEAPMPCARSGCSGPCSPGPVPDAGAQGGSRPQTQPGLAAA